MQSLSLSLSLCNLLFWLWMNTLKGMYTIIRQKSLLKVVQNSKVMLHVSFNLPVVGKRAKDPEIWAFYAENVDRLDHENETVDTGRWCVCVELSCVGPLPAASGPNRGFAILTLTHTDTHTDTHKPMYVHAHASLTLLLAMHNLTTNTHTKTNTLHASLSGRHVKVASPLPVYPGHDSPRSSNESPFAVYTVQLVHRPAMLCGGGGGGANSVGMSSVLTRQTLKEFRFK